MKKKAISLSFNWIFAIIAGVFILLIALYATTRLVNNSQDIVNSESALQLLNYLNPVVSGVMSSYATKFKFNKETRIYVNCSDSTSNSPVFGRETIAFSEQSGFLKKWPNPGVAVPRYNKYIFSENVMQGKEFYIFSKPFFTGFKVDDLITISTGKYCFIAPPTIIEEEINLLGVQNINITSTVTLCPKESVKVCFENSFAECNMTVYGECSSFDCETEYDHGYIMKKGKRMYYFGNLLYAGIFSSPEIYECNVKRLGKKVSQLASVYIGKIDIVKLKDCETIISPFLEQIRVVGGSVNSSRGIIDIYDASKSMDEENCNSNCRIYPPEGC